jgi:hypothetical protein
MDAPTIDAVGFAFDATAERYGLTHLSAIMSLSLFEALIPTAPEAAKAESIKQIEKMGGRLGKKEFVELVQYLRSSCWCPNEELAAAATEEAKRQRFHGSRFDPSVVAQVPSASLAEELQRALEDRDRIIQEQKAKLEELQLQSEMAKKPLPPEHTPAPVPAEGITLSKGSKPLPNPVGKDNTPASSALATILYLEKRCTEAEQQLKSVSSQLTLYGDYGSRNSRVINEARALAEENRRIGKEAARQDQRRTMLSSDALYNHHVSGSTGGGASGGSPAQPNRSGGYGFSSPMKARATILTPSASPSMRTPLNPFQPTSYSTPTDTILPSQTLRAVAEANRVLRSVPGSTQQGSGRSNAMSSASGQPTSSFLSAPAYSSCRRLETVYHMMDLERQNTHHMVTHSPINNDVLMRKHRQEAEGATTAAAAAAAAANAQYGQPLGATHRFGDPSAAAAVALALQAQSSPRPSAMDYSSSSYKQNSFTPRTDWGPDLYPNRSPIRATGPPQAQLYSLPGPTSPDAVLYANLAALNSTPRTRYHH